MLNAAASGLGESMVLTKGPPWLRPWFVSGNPGDAFCGWPPDQAARFTKQMKQGGIAGVLMGHASDEAYFSMRFNGRPVWYAAANAAGEFRKGPPVPPMVFFSCMSGKFDQAEPCQAKALLLMSGGPVATIGATTESHPLTNYFSGVCLLKALGGPEKRLARSGSRAQREARQAHDFVMEMALRDAEGSLEPTIDIEKLRRDQALIYALLGDPATRLRLPDPLQVSARAHRARLAVACRQALRGRRILRSATAPHNRFRAFRHPGRRREGVGQGVRSGQRVPCLRRATLAAG